MRIVKPSRILQFQKAYPKAASALGRWLEIAENHDWPNIQALRRVFRSADAVEVQSGKTVTIFNIAGNDFRLITAIHYNRRIIYVMLFLTHAQYDKDTWKDNL